MHDTPEHLLVETQIESDTLSTTFFIRRSNRGELTVPCLAVSIPTGHLKNTRTPSVTVSLVGQLDVQFKTGPAHTNKLTGSPFSGLITLLWSKLNLPLSSYKNREKTNQIIFLTRNT